MRSTVSLLSNAFPAGIPVGDLPPLIELMRESGMSNRAIAEALTLAHGGDYDDYLYQISHVVPTSSISSKDKERLRRQMLPYGFEQWAEEK
jgi:hypothetical protein